MSAKTSITGPEMVVVLMPLNPAISVEYSRSATPLNLFAFIARPLKRRADCLLRNATPLMWSPP